MEKGVDHSIKLGFLFIALSGSLLGQAPTAIPADRGLPADAAAASPLAAPGSNAHDNSFVIGNDDQLAINVWKEPDLTRSIPVRSDGKISLPLVGELQAAGRTPLQLEQEISAKLMSYITEPEVTVIVQQINSQKFNILGQVAKPGSYPLAAATTILDAIAAAGGFRDFAKQKGIYILRQNASGGEARIPFNYKDVIRGKNPQQNIKLEPRDTIVVP
jgi:polysaccharide export outer membrane protein